MASQPLGSRPENVRVAIICALPREYDAAVLAFDEVWENNGVTQSCNHKVGRMGGHIVVLVLLPNMGKASAANETGRLRSTFPGLELAILTGICGGVPSPGTDNEILLGDVVISKSIIQYDLGRQYPDKFVRKDSIEDSLGRPSKDIRTLLAMLETQQGSRDLRRQTSQNLRELQQSAVEARYQTCYDRPVASKDVLFESDYFHRHQLKHDCGCSEENTCNGAICSSCGDLQCDTQRQVRRKRLDFQMTRNYEHGTDTHDFRIHMGCIGTADTVVKSGQHRDQIAREHGIVAFEMEGAGVWDEVPCIIIKGVSDYADSHKNKVWQDFAAAIAASTTKALLKCYSRRDAPRATSTYFLVPYNENPDFVGRSDALAYLKRNFGHDQQQAVVKPRSRIAIYGLGGVGKTQIALAYVYWLKNARPEMSIFWVHASSVERFRQAYASIAEACQVPGRDHPKADLLKLVKEWLENEARGPWLMVIDNADDTQVFFAVDEDSHTGTSPDANEAKCKLGPYIPTCIHGSILITTRNKQAGSRVAPGKPPLKIDKMNDSEAEELLSSMLELSDHNMSTEDALTLSSRLEHLPLALAQAASFISENETTIEIYVKLLDESDSALVDYLSEPFEAVGRDSATPHALTATWVISFEQIEKSDIIASDVLSLMSYFDRQVIPKEYIIEYLRNRPEYGHTSMEAKFTKAMGTLKAFSFITQSKNQSADMHRLVHLITQKWLLKKGNSDHYIQEALRITSVLFPSGSFETREICRQQLPHASTILQHRGTGSNDEELSRARLLTSLAAYLGLQGHNDETKEKCSQAVELRKRILGDKHPDTLYSMYCLSLIDYAMGLHDKSERRIVQVIETNSEINGEMHPFTLSCKEVLMLLLMNGGYWKESERIGAEITNLRTRLLGEDHPDTLKALNRLALIYKGQGRLEEAEVQILKVLQTQRRVLGEGHHHTLNSSSALARIYLAQHRLKEAEELLTRVLEKRTRVLGEEHPETLTSLTGLVFTYSKQGGLKEVEKCFRKAADLVTKVLGEGHRTTLKAMYNVAVLNAEQGRLQEAEKLATRIFEMYTKTLGVDHADTLDAMEYLSEVLCAQDRKEEASRLRQNHQDCIRQKYILSHSDSAAPVQEIERGR